MGYPNSVEEIDIGMVAEGIEELLNSDDLVAIEDYRFRQGLAREQKRADIRQGGDFCYWLDNCGDGGMVLSALFAARVYEERS